MPMPELTQLSCKYGAPMGRRETHDIDREDPAKFYLQYVPFVDGAYDRGGAYWGCPANLYRAYAAFEWDPNEKVLETEMFVRANSRDEAKAKVREEYPNATFFR